MFSHKIVRKVCFQFPNGRLLFPREFGIILMMQNFFEENKLQHGERESPKLRGKKLRFNFVGLSFVSFVRN